MAFFLRLKIISLGGTTTSVFALGLNLLLTMLIFVPQDPDPDVDPNVPSLKYIALTVDGDKSTNCTWFKIFGKVLFAGVGEGVNDNMMEMLWALTIEKRNSCHQYPQNETC